MDRAAESQPLDLRAYARVLRRRKWIFLAVAVVVPVLVYFASARGPKVYQSSVLMEVEPTSVDNSTSTSGGPTAEFISIAARLIQTTGVAEGAARVLSLPQAEGPGLLGSIKVTTDPNTGFLTITASSGSPQRAADIANAFAQAVNSERARQAITQLDQTISNLQSQLNALPQRAFTPRRQLSGQITRLRAQRAAQGTNTQVIEPAVASSSPVSPQPRRNTELAVIVGLLLGLGAVALAENLDRRIRRPEELEELAGLPLLISLSRSAFSGNVQAPAVADRFSALRANLSFFNVDRDIKSIAVVSGRQGEGKSLVSIGLANAYTAAGYQVILVDADLRRPTIASRLGMPAGAGLGGVLAGESSLPAALLQQVHEGRPTGLRVLPSGRLPPNPSELLGSDRMQQLLGELSEMADILIIDTSPLLAVSDALPLIDSASGALVVVRLGLSHREELRHVRKILDASTSVALGIVATGASQHGSYPYEYAGYVSPPVEEASRNGDAEQADDTLLSRLRR